MTCWFTADQHFWHEGIIEYEDRPWKNAEQMNRELVKLHNEVVAPRGDTVYFLGDLTLRSPDCRNSLEKLIQSMNGEKILILGNHDRLKPFAYVDIGFESVHTSLRFDLPGGGGSDDYIYLVHDPALATLDRSKLFLCGHVHGLFTQAGNAINVGVDVRHYRPVSLDAIRGDYKEKLGS